MVLSSGVEAGQHLKEMCCKKSPSFVNRLSKLVNTQISNPMGFYAQIPRYFVNQLVFNF